MKKLSDKAIKQWYFIKEEVVFGIKSSNQKKDSCAFEGIGVTWNEELDEEGKVTGHSVDVSTATVPYIKVVDNTVESFDLKDKEAYYYLDCFIANGDKCVGEEHTFSKTVHSEDKEHENEITFFEYFEQLLEEELENIVERNFNKDFEWFKDNLVLNGFPAYALVGDEYTVEGFSQIDFTEEKLKEIKDGIVFREVFAAAKKRAQSFEYEVSDDLKECIESFVHPIEEEEEP